MPVGPVNALPPAAFRSLIRAVENALRPACALDCLPPALVRTPCYDSVDCRLLLNDAVAEIERLRREIAGLEATPHGLQPPPACEHSRSIDSLSLDLSKATSARRAYAVALIGEVRITLPSADLPPPLLPLRTSSVVTNLGTLMDVLV